MAKRLVYPYRKRINARIPFGYKAHPDDDKLLEPIPSEINALRKAVKYVKDGHSYQTARDWLVATTQRDISAIGLWKICKRWNKIKRQYACARPPDGITGEDFTESEE